MKESTRDLIAGFLAIILFGFICFAGFAILLKISFSLLGLDYTIQKALGLFIIKILFFTNFHRKGD